jgi:hypothetical protein
VQKHVPIFSFYIIPKKLGIIGAKGPKEWGEGEGIKKMERLQKWVLYILQCDPNIGIENNVGSIYALQLF